MPSIGYQDPVDRGPLVQTNTAFTNPRTGVSYPITDGIPVFLPPGAVEGPNARYQELYNRIAPAYDLATRAYALWQSGTDESRRRAYLDLLQVRDGISFLEVSVGTGANWPYLNRTMDFYGLDLSPKMVARCARRARSLGLRFELCQGLAEHLPYPDAAFDCVFHMGGINFFTDPAAALSEMVRVAKSGTRLLIADETEKQAKRHENKLFAGAFFKNRPRTIVAPVNLLPPGMKEVDLREIWDGELYVLTFRKP